MNVTPYGMRPLQYQIGYFDCTLKRDFFEYLVDYVVRVRGIELIGFFWWKQRVHKDHKMSLWTFYWQYVRKGLFIERPIAHWCIQFTLLGCYMWFRVVATDVRFQISTSRRVLFTRATRIR